MIVSSTEVQNNFGKYLRLAAKEDIIVTRNGVEIARLISTEENKDPISHEIKVHESAESYHSEGKSASFKRFLELSQADEIRRYEYIDGKIYAQASPTISHQYAVSKLLAAFDRYFQQSRCTPFTAPNDIRLKRLNQEAVNVVQPDLMVICDLDENLNEEDYYIGVPSLIVEVLTKSTQSIDLVKKLDLYMSSGVKEYWIVNPVNKEITIYGFENYMVEQTGAYKNTESAHSFIYDGLSVELENIFRP